MVAPARSLLLLAALTCSLQPSAAIYFFSREEAPTPEPASAGPARCVCSVSDWCAPVLFPKVDRTEVFAFVINTTAKTWQTFDWKKLTTIVLFNFMDPELVCLAHKHNVRVLENANFLKANVTNATYRAEWASLHVKYVEQHYLDGINVDFEEPVGDKEPARAAYVQLMNETRHQLNTYHPTAVLAVDVPWSPDCIDGRCYDFMGLYNFTDMLFIMGYDLRSTVYSKDCTAGANSPLNLTLAGVREYMAMGMTASKLVLGVPWYGYDYACLNVTHNGTVCDIERVHFYNASCSDAAGVQRPFWKLDVWSQTALQSFWSNASQSPYFNIKFADWNMTHQVWYDNVTSLTYKYMGAASLKLRGVGIWAANFLASGNSSWARAQRDSMWGALPLSNWQDGGQRLTARRPDDGQRLTARRPDDGQRLTARRPDAQRRLRYGTAAAADRHVELALLGEKWLGNELAEQGGPHTIVARAPQPVVED